MRRQLVIVLIRQPITGSSRIQQTQPKPANTSHMRRQLVLVLIGQPVGQRCHPGVRLAAQPGLQATVTWWMGSGPVVRI